MTTLGTLGGVLLLGSVGLLMGALSLTGWFSTRAEFGLWVLVGILWVVGGAWLGLPRPVSTLVLVGLVAGVCTGGVQATFAQILVDNNEAYAEDVEDPVDSGTRLGFFGVALGVGLVWGLLFGLLAWGLRASDLVTGWS